jgi:hypothetical protein
MGAVTLGKPKVPHTTSASAHSRALSRSLSLSRARARSLSLSLSLLPSLPPCLGAAVCHNNRHP